jgi:hypothetical protein
VPKWAQIRLSLSFDTLCVIARNEAIQINCFPYAFSLDCFTAFAMTRSDVAQSGTKFVAIRGASRKIP